MKFVHDGRLRRWRLPQLFRWWSLSEFGFHSGTSLTSVGKEGTMKMDFVLIRAWQSVQSWWKLSLGNAKLIPVSVHSTLDIYSSIVPLPGRTLDNVVDFLESIWNVFACSENKTPKLRNHPKLRETEEASKEYFGVWLTLTITSLRILSCDRRFLEVFVECIRKIGMRKLLLAEHDRQS